MTLRVLLDDMIILVIRVCQIPESLELSAPQDSKNRPQHILARMKLIIPMESLHGGASQEI